MRVRHRALARLVAAAFIAAATIGAPAAFASSDTTATSVALSASPPSPQHVGTTVLIAVALSPADAVGTVKLYDGATLLDKGRHYTRLWSYVTSSFAVGTHDLRATFTPDDSAYDPSDGSMTYVISGDAMTATSTTLAVSPSAHLNAGQPAIFSAAVEPATADGTVTFMAGSQRLGAAAVDDGGASLTSSALAVGTHAVTATFVASTPGFAGSASDPLTVDVATIGGSISPTPTPSPSHSPTPKPSKTPKPTKSPTATPSPTHSDAQTVVATVPSGAVKGEHGNRGNGDGNGNGNSGGPLPFTGLDTITQLLAAAGLLGFGVLMIVIGRRRPASPKRH